MSKLTKEEIEEIAENLTVLELSEMIADWYSDDWLEAEYEMNDIHKIAKAHTELYEYEDVPRGAGL